MHPSDAEGVAYDSFPLERTVETAAVTMTETHIVNWATLTGDWYPLHMDEEFARESGPFGRRVAHGPLVYALTVGLTERSGAFGHAILAWLGIQDMRAHAPVFIGDTIHGRTTVVDRRLSSDPARGVVTVLQETVNQSDVVVLSCRYSMLMRVR